MLKSSPGQKLLALTIIQKHFLAKYLGSFGKVNSLSPWVPFF
jgi:hypothetical protein